ncbi:MAG: 2-C-methyl-D-erythritol 4-phosphate cytidylyltransferase [Bacteroidales bacterium]|nr:2-C-methyl-D-erythritol 4-phosphate cytidylyltransferase [Bacteroidales bacterium]MBQ2913109.1 2-C-methyl-D-erythritol 4-phosphate cytidylyltransferase [Bacteroidales bacterium]MBR2478005.1 2-C-methyl-D-erythritol 4-phosphate cytidylyltransferase [Bacteroidales bacterium]
MASLDLSKTYVIITAGGVGKRMGGKTAKQFIELEGKPVLLRTIEMFRGLSPDINIILTLPQEYKEYWRNYCFENGLWFRHTIVSGGITRFHSVKNALEHVPEGAVVAVHDGVRPFVPHEMLVSLLGYNFAKEGVAGVIPVMPSIESMRIRTYGEDGMPNGSRTVNRDEYMFVQTPQVFDSTILKDCYKKPYSPTFTDDASVVESNGYKVATSPGSRFNIKLTTPEDLVMARIFLSLMEE